MDHVFIKEVDCSLIPWEEAHGGGSQCEPCSVPSWQIGCRQNDCVTVAQNIVTRESPQPWWPELRTPLCRLTGPRADLRLTPVELE